MDLLHFVHGELYIGVGQTTLSELAEGKEGSTLRRCKIEKIECALGNKEFFLAGQESRECSVLIANVGTLYVTRLKVLPNSNN